MTKVSSPSVESTVRDFAYDALPGRVVFARRAARERLAAEIERLGVERVMLIVGPGQRELAAELVVPFAGRVVVHYDQVRPHVPREVAEHAREAARRVKADALLSVGGGSTTGTAKIVALTQHLPVVAVPTTYAGSEMTPVWGMTTGTVKNTGRDLAVLPRVVVYDPELVETLPAALAVASALNAMAHCLESLWTSAAPLVESMALDGARSLAAGLSAAAAGRPAADALLYGAYLAGAAFASAGSGLHHRICHALGGGFDLPHAQTHAVVLPHVLAFNAPAVPAAMARLAPALGADDPVTGLRDLYRRCHAPRSLAEIGLARADLPRAIELVTARLPVDNPAPSGRTTSPRC